MGGIVGGVEGGAGPCCSELGSGSDGPPVGRRAVHLLWEGVDTWAGELSAHQTPCFTEGCAALGPTLPVMLLIPRGSRSEGWAGALASPPSPTLSCHRASWL